MKNTRYEKYYNLESMIALIDEPNKSICEKFMQEERTILEVARGSKANHQAWEGGYIDHLSEAMNTGIILYDTISIRRSLDFPLSDLLLVLFLHDIEKPWKYEKIEDKWQIKSEFADRQKVKEFALAKIKEYGFVLNEQHLNGLEYVEGEIGSHSHDSRKMLPIAAMAHMCDTWSARGWPNEPQTRNSWR